MGLSSSFKMKEHSSGTVVLIVPECMVQSMAPNYCLLFYAFDAKAASKTGNYFATRTTNSQNRPNKREKIHNGTSCTDQHKHRKQDALTTVLRYFYTRAIVVVGGQKK